MKSIRNAAVLLLTLMATMPLARTQSVTGQISGTVVDATGGAILGVEVQLAHDVSKQVRKFTTDSTGSFSFVNLVPGDYSVHFAVAGFKTYDQKGVKVYAQERVDLHEIKLSVGEVSSTVEVQATSVNVATNSSDRAISIGTTQIMDTPTRGRNAVNLIMTLPGVQTLASNDFRGWSAVNSGQIGQVILNLDGVAAQYSGNLNPGYLAPSVDAIGEVKLLVSRCLPPVSEGHMYNGSFD